MHQARTWPSRRLQIGVIAVLAIGAAIAMFSPPLTKVGRAQKLYHDSWFLDPSGMTMWHVGSDARGLAVKYVNRALNIYPDNSFFQQALLWHSDRRNLPEVLKEHNFGPSAQRLAAGLMYTAERQKSIHLFTKHVGHRHATQAELVDFWNRQIPFVDSLMRADPDNGLVHFRKAQMLMKAGRVNEALEEIRVGDRKAVISSYVPDVPASVLDAQYSTSGSLIFDDGDIELFTPLSKFLFGIARIKFEGGKPAEGLAALEECCLMGVRLAELHPYSIKAFVTGRQLFKSSWTILKPAYEAAGLKDRAAQLAKVDEAFNWGMVAVRSSDYSSFLVHKWPVTAFPWTFQREFSISLLLLFGAAFWWIPPVVSRILRASDPFCHIPWGEGWLARVLLYTYLPVFAVIMVTVLLLPSLMTRAMESPFFIVPELLVILPSLIVPVKVLKRLHSEHDAKLGVRTGMLRFLLGSSASVKIWTRKSLLAATLAQVLFVICCGFLMTIVYRPVFRALPWDSDRFMSERYSMDRSLVGRSLKDIRMTSFVRESETPK